MSLKLKSSSAGWRIVTRWHRVSVAFLLLALLLPPPLVSSQEVPISLNLLVLSSNKKTTVKVAEYLKKLIEKRTDLRLAASIYSSPTLLNLVETEKQLDSKIQLIVTKDTGYGTDNLSPTGFIPVKGEDDKFQMLAASIFWKELPSDLQIILQGAIKDALTYSAELDR